MSLQVEKLEKNISTMIELENKLDECKRLQEKYNIFKLISY